MSIASMTRKPQKSIEELRTERISRKYAGKTDRQLIEEQTYLTVLNTHHTNKIKKDVRFFFWLAIISLIVWIAINILAAMA